MTYKQIEQAREIRLWLGQVIVPAALGVGMILSNPEARSTIARTGRKIKDDIKWTIEKRKFRKVD